MKETRDFGDLAINALESLREQQDLTHSLVSNDAKKTRVLFVGLWQEFLRNSDISTVHLVIVSRVQHAFVSPLLGSSESCCCDSAPRAAFHVANAGKALRTVRLRPLDGNC